MAALTGPLALVPPDRGGWLCPGCGRGPPCAGFARAPLAAHGGSTAAADAPVIRAARAILSDGRKRFETLSRGTTVRKRPAFGGPPVAKEGEVPSHPARGVAHPGKHERFGAAFSAPRPAVIAPRGRKHKELGEAGPRLAPRSERRSGRKITLPLVVSVARWRDAGDGAGARGRHEGERHHAADDGGGRPEPPYPQEVARRARSCPRRPGRRVHARA